MVDKEKCIGCGTCVSICPVGAISFDANGNAIVQAQELEKLQREISKASEERKPVLQAEYDEIMDNVEAYNKAKDKSAISATILKREEYLLTLYPQPEKYKNMSRAAEIEYINTQKGQQ